MSITITKGRQTSNHFIIAFYDVGSEIDDAPVAFSDVAGDIAGYRPSAEGATVDFEKLTDFGNRI